jgi:hypothetical protein
LIVPLLPPQSKLQPTELASTTQSNQVSTASWQSCVHSDWHASRSGHIWSLLISKHDDPAKVAGKESARHWEHPDSGCSSNCFTEAPVLEVETDRHDSICSFFSAHTSKLMAGVSIPVPGSDTNELQFSAGQVVADWIQQDM